MKEKWYPLDNAAQIFPLISKKRYTNSFRFSAVLKEEVDPILLKEALKESLKRFPTFSVRLKKGVFWYYLEQNEKDVVIREEDPYFCESNNYKIQNDYLFNLSYFQKRISIEIFHGLSDGTGGIEFFKAILYNYLLTKNIEINNTGEVLTEEVEELIDEAQDSFKFNYKNKICKTGKEVNAYKIDGKLHNYEWVDCIQAIMDMDSLKEVSKKYDCTITQFISSVLLYQIYYQFYIYDDSKKPIRLFIPVNARNYFGSKTLRNFALFIRTNSKFNGNISFEEVVVHIKETFKEELSKERMLARIKTNIKLEKNFFVRYMILPLKTLLVRMVYKIIGTGSNTLSFSNIGKVNLPREMEKYIDRIDFANSASRDAKLNAALISYNKKTILTFSSVLIERHFQYSVIKMLKVMGVILVVTTNDLEV